MAPSIEELVEQRNNVTIKDLNPPMMPWEVFSGLGGGLMGAKMVCFYKRIPLISGIPIYAASIAAGFGMGYLGYKARVHNQTLINAETTVYIESFPERFPELQKEVPKFADVLDYWTPKRAA